MLVQLRFKNIPVIILKAFIIAQICLVFMSQLFADEMSRGEIAGVIRSAEHPCKNVLALESTGKNSWKVECNSGSYIVIRKTDGEFIVQSAEKK